MSLFSLTVLACAMTPAVWADEEPALDTPTPVEAVAVINGEAVPREWFLHEFRSTFFRHQPTDDIRSVVFDAFLNRLLLAEKAREMKLDQDPALAAAIEDRISNMRAFMEYQLAMTKITMLNDALVKSLELKFSAEDVTDDELKTYFDEQISPRPGAPPSFDLVPPHVLPSLRQQVAQQKLEKALAAMIEEWKTNWTIEIDQAAVDSVPFPEMEHAPPGFAPPPASSPGQ